MKISALAVALLLATGCSSSPAASDASAPDAGHLLTFHNDAGARDAAMSRKDAAVDAAVDATAPARDATHPIEAAAPEAGMDAFTFPDVIDIGPPDVTVKLPDAAPDAPKLNACGICDRKWNCNGFTDTWESTGADSCADVRSGHAVVTLYCENGDTIDFPSATDNDGTWSQSSTGLAIDFNSFGSVMEIDCVPGM